MDSNDVTFNDATFNDAEFDCFNQPVNSYSTNEYIQPPPSQTQQFHQNRPVSPKMGRTKPNIQLWQFLRKLLSDPEMYGKSIRWVNESEGNSFYLLVVYFLQ